MAGISYKDWHIPLSRDEITLREATEDLARLGAKQEQIPLMIQLVENPRFDLPGFDIFHGAVDLKTHDRIHILLGRGSTHRVSTLEENLYSFFSKHLYPKVYQFKDDDIGVFKDAVKLGYISDCQPLNESNYDEFLDKTLRDVRAELGIEIPLLKAYFEIEKRRYPNSKASQRLLT